MGFNAKNLSYESNEPSFLRKLRSQYSGAGSDRHERPMPRPRKQMKDGEDDDGPTYVLEDSQDTMSKDEYEAFLRGKDADESHPQDPPPSEKVDKTDDESSEEHTKPTKEVELVKEHTATIGASSKRRLAKIIDGEEEAERDLKDDSPRAQKKPKTKSKKIKLSFDEEAGS